MDEAMNQRAKEYRDATAEANPEQKEKQIIKKP